MAKMKHVEITAASLDFEAVALAARHQKSGSFPHPRSSLRSVHADLGRHRHPLVVEMSGVFGGAQVFSCSFQFQPDTDDLIRGDLDPELSEEEATKMNQVLTKQRVMAKMKMTTVSTRYGEEEVDVRANGTSTDSGATAS